MAPRSFVAVWLVALVMLAAAASCTSAPDPSRQGVPTAAGPTPTGVGTPAPVPVPGHEIYGFVPYWEMDDGIAAHLRSTPLSTLALFSVTNTSTGAINAKANGFQRINGAVGRQVIREAHERGVRVELVFTSFGLERNAGLFGDRALQDATIASLVALVGDLQLDGVNVDVESLDPLLVPAYGAFVRRLRQAVVAADGTDQVSVATSANAVGAAMAAAAGGGGADRIFLMGYDYRTAGSSPGASAPLARRDGEDKDLVWSLDLYATLGIPVERTLLGLPLYGMEWPVAGPVVGAPETGRGKPWILRGHLDVLRDRAIRPIRDEVEMVEVYLFASDGSTPPPPTTGLASPRVSAPAGSVPDRAWRAVYVDSPETLAPKLALANARGLAGAGFWAIGYERGLPGYTEVIARFAAGRPME